MPIASDNGSINFSDRNCTFHPGGDGFNTNIEDTSTRDDGNYSGHNIDNNFVHDPGGEGSMASCDDSNSIGATTTAAAAHQ